MVHYSCGLEAVFLTGDEVEMKSLCGLSSNMAGVLGKGGEDPDTILVHLGWYNRAPQGL